jgi:hypothetical protein
MWDFRVGGFEWVVLGLIFSVIISCTGIGAWYFIETFGMGRYAIGCGIVFAAWTVLMLGVGFHKL